MKDDLERLKAQLAPKLALTKAALKDLASKNGTFWKEALGELHSQYNQIPIWVLLYEDNDLLESHRALCETLKPHMKALEPLQIVLCYEVFCEVKVMDATAFFASLSGNDKVFSAGADGTMDLTWIPSSMGYPTVFDSLNSKRP